MINSFHEFDALLAFIALSAAQSSAQTHIHSAIVVIDTSNHAWHSQVHWLVETPYLAIKASNECKELVKSQQISVAAVRVTGQSSEKSLHSRFVIEGEGVRGQPLGRQHVESVATSYTSQMYPGTCSFCWKFKWTDKNLEFRPHRIMSFNRQLQS